MIPLKCKWRLLFNKEQNPTFVLCLFPRKYREISHVWFYYENYETKLTIIKINKKFMHFQII